MDAFIGFHFMFDDAEKYPDGRHFVIKFDVTPSAELAAKLDGSDRDFTERLYSLFDDEMEIFGEDWETNNFDIMGWLSHDLWEEEDPVPVLEKLRNFFLKEGLRGGEITEMSEAEFDQLALSNHAELLRDALEAL